MSIFSLVPDIKRFRQIATVMFRHGFGEIIERMGVGDNLLIRKLQSSDAPKKEKISIGRRLYLVLSELGPTYVKLGQILSTRQDLLPEAIITELMKLQDDVPSVPFEKIVEQIKAELGTTPEEIFQSIDPVSIASASIAQVHKGVLKDGTEVAIKVQKPGIKSIIESDIDLMHFFARVIENRIPEARVYQPINMISEFERTILKELNFTFEANNLERFYQNSLESEDVVIPQVFKEFSGKRLITMTFLPGVKVTDYKKVGADPKIIARKGIKILCKQIFEDGFFHADPHPGNVFVLEGNRLGFLDVGNVGTLSDALREKLLTFIIALAREDKDTVANIIYDLAIKETKVDLKEFREHVGHMLDNVYGQSLKAVEFDVVFRDIVQNARKFQMRIPSNLIAVFRAMIIIEGIGKTLDPDMIIVDEIKPILVKLMWVRWNPEKVSQNLLQGISDWKHNFTDFPRHLSEIVEDLRRGTLTVGVTNQQDQKMRRLLDVASLRVTFGLILSAIIMSASLVTVLGKWNEIGGNYLGIGMSLGAGVIGFWFLVSMVRTGRWK